MTLLADVETLSKICARACRRQRRKQVGFEPVVAASKSSGALDAERETTCSYGARADPNPDRGRHSLCKSAKNQSYDACGWDIYARNGRGVRRAMLGYGQILDDQDYS